MAEFPEDFATPVESTTTPTSDYATPVVDQNPSLPPAVANDRATKADYGLGDKVPMTYPDYYSAFIRGQEKYVRNQVANQLAIKNQQYRSQVISNIANSKGGPLTTEEIAGVDDFINDPRSVIEDHYAKRYVDALNWNDPNNNHWLNNLEGDEAYTWQNKINLGTEYTAKSEFFKTRQQEANEALSNQGYFSWGIDELKNLTTIYPWMKAHTQFSNWYDLPGKAQEHTRDELLTLPYEDMKNKYDEIYNRLPPNLRVQFATNMVGMSSSDQLMQDIFPLIQPGVEVGAVAGLGGAIFRRNAMNTAIRQQIQSAAVQAGLSPTQQAALAAGNVASSAGQRAWGSLVSMARRSDPIRDAQEGLVNLLKVERQKLFVNDGGDINGTNMMAEEIDRMISQVPEMFKSLTMPERFPGLVPNERNQEILVAAAQAVRDRARDVSDRFLTVEEPYQEPISRNWWANAIIGKSSLDQFGSQGEAGRFAAKTGIGGFRIESREYPLKAGERVLSDAEAQSIFGKDMTSEGLLTPNTKVIVGEGEGNVRVEQRGSGWVIVKPYLIPEDAPAMRPFYARLPTEQVPEGGVINSLLARFRTPNETQSAWANRNRESATFVSSVLERYAFDQAEDIRKMQPLIPFTRGSEKWNDWERVLNAARKEYDENGLIGKTYRNIGELNEAYMKTVGRLPDEQEKAAYFAFVRVNDFDHVMRTISIMKHKQRLGTMEHKITLMDQGLRKESPAFDGMSQSEFPGGDHSIAIVDATGKVNYRRLDALGMRQRTSTFTQSNRDYYKDQVEKGKMQVVKLYAPERYPLSGYGGLKSSEFVEYVMAPSNMLSNKPLAWGEQLPKRGGGHFDYSHPFHSSQLDIREEQIGSRKRQVLVGKNTGFTFKTRADAERVTGLMNQVRELMSKGKRTAFNEAAAKNIVENMLTKDAPGITWADVKAMFVPPPSRSKATGQWSKGSKPRFNTTEPFRVHLANENLMNKVGEDELKARYPNYLDGRTRSPSQQFTTQYSQERDAQELFTFNNVGTPDNPMYRYEPSPLVDAIPTMNRAVNKISNSLAMDDMKINAVNSWIQQAKQFLNVPDSQLNASPLYWFHHGAFLNDPLNARRINELEVARQQIKSFVGQVSQSDAVMHYWAQKLSDTIYTNKYLTKFANKLDPVWLAHTLTDPTRFFRAMTFHMKMGLFAIPQILVQGQTYVNILGIAGATRATQGTAAALMHQWTRINASPRILSAIGRHLEKFGYKPGEFEAMREAGLSTGFLNVGGEYALRDNPMSNKVIQSRWGQFLQLGALPFTEGERNVRLGAWYTAAKEYADKKAVSQWTNADKLEVLNRAALLNGNMNRASNAMFQRGFAALPAQFLTYTIRQAELMWGKRLTSAEKARLLLTNAMAYGLPVGIGITGLPSDFFRNAALEAGYNPGDNYMNTLITEGIPSTILALVDHDRYWNVGERFGNAGLNDIFYGDKTIWDIAGGAAYSSVSSFMEAFDPFRQAIMSGVRQDGNNFNITYEHLLQPLREITSFNSAERAIIAAQTGKWISKTDNPLLRNVTVPEALMSFITGLQPQDVADLRHITDIKTSEENVQKWAERKFQQEVRRSLDAFDGGDPDNGKTFMTNAMMYLNVYSPSERKEEWLSRAFDGYQDVVQRVRQSFGTKDVPPELERQRIDSWIKGIR